MDEVAAPDATMWQMMTEVGDAARRLVDYGRRSGQLPDDDVSVIVHAAAGGECSAVIGAGDAVFQMIMAGATSPGYAWTNRP